MGCSLGIYFIKISKIYDSSPILILVNVLSSILYRISS